MLTHVSRLKMYVVWMGGHLIISSGLSSYGRYGFKLQDHLKYFVLSISFYTKF